MAHTLRRGAFVWKGLQEFTRKAYEQKSKYFVSKDMDVDLTDRVAVITGANQGIGKAAATALASKGASIYMVSRSHSRGEQARAEVARKASSSAVHLRVCDMGNLEQVRTLAAELSSLSVYALVQNAGCLLHERVLTDDGIESNFAVNVCGPYLLTELLAPQIQRLIVVSSGGAYSETLASSVKDMMLAQHKFDGTMQYARNKRQQIALCEHWAQKYSGTLEVCASMHPGWADTTAGARTMHT